MNQISTLKEVIELIKIDEGYPFILQQFSGIEDDETGFFNTLYDLSTSPKVQVFEEVLDKRIDNQKFQKLEQLFQIIKENPQLSIKRIIAFMQGFELTLPSAQLEAYLEWLTDWCSEQGGVIQVTDTFRRVLTDCIKWSFTYLEEELYKAPHQRKVQLWYQSVTPSLSKEWFMKLSKALGFSILYFDLSKTHASVWLPKVEWPKRSEPQPLPTQRVEEVTTLARTASREFNALMNQADESGQGAALFFKPYQFKEAKLKVIPLRTTYDELKILGTSEAYLRPGFKVSGDELLLPVLLAKVNGLPEKEQEYWNQLEALHPIEFRHQEALSSTPQEKAHHFALYHEFINSPSFNAEQMIEQAEWPYGQLATGAQLTLATAMIEAVKNPKVELKPHEKLDLLETTIYEVLLHLPLDLIKVFHQFDYPKEVPKLLWFDRPNEEMTREDAIQFLLFHAIGFDCLIYSPNGLNSLENHLVGLTIDVFWLDQLKDYTLENKKTKKGFLQRFLGEG